MDRTRRRLLGGTGVALAGAAAGCVERFGSEQTIAEATAGQVHTSPEGPIESRSPSLATYSITLYDLPFRSRTEVQKDGSEVTDDIRWYVDWMDKMGNWVEQGLPEDTRTRLDNFVGYARTIREAGETVAAYSAAVTEVLATARLEEALATAREYYDAGRHLLAQFRGLLDYLRDLGVYEDLRETGTALVTVRDRIESVATALEDLFAAAGRYLNGTTVDRPSLSPAPIEDRIGPPGEGFGADPYPFSTLGIPASLPLFEHVTGTDRVDWNYVAQFYLPPLETRRLRGSDIVAVGGMGRDVAQFTAAWGALATALEETATAVESLEAAVGDLSGGLARRLLPATDAVITVARLGAATATAYREELAAALSWFEDVYRYSR